jgi:hypothetical protein
MVVGFGSTPAVAVSVEASTPAVDCTASNRSCPEITIAGDSPATLADAEPGARLRRPGASHRQSERAWHCMDLRVLCPSSQARWRGQDPWRRPLDKTKTAAVELDPTDEPEGDDASRVIAQVRGGS